MSGGASALSLDLAACRGDDGALGDALAGLLARLRGHPFGRFYGRPEEALSDDANRFVGRLARHLRFAEDTLFPALQEVEPMSAHPIEELEQDHRLLHLYARDLALQILGRDKEGAYRVGRSFLAVLLDHIRRETESVNAVVRVLSVSDARRLSEALVERRPAGGSGEFPSR